MHATLLVSGCIYTTLTPSVLRTVKNFEAFHISTTSSFFSVSIAEKYSTSFVALSTKSPRLIVLYCKQSKWMTSCTQVHFRNFEICTMTRTHLSQPHDRLLITWISMTVPTQSQPKRHHFPFFAFNSHQSHYSVGTLKDLSYATARKGGEHTAFAGSTGFDAECWFLWWRQ